jgi:hypothetical protein
LSKAPECMASGANETETQPKEEQLNETEDPLVIKTNEDEDKRHQPRSPRNKTWRIRRRCQSSSTGGIQQP